MHGESGPEDSAAVPGQRHTWGVRVAAALAAAGVFWLDAHVSLGIAVPSLYVASVLLFIWGGHPWEALVAAAGVTALALAGILLSPPGGSAELARINRPLEILIVWISAAVVTYYRFTVRGLAVQRTKADAALDESTRRLHEIRYALDQAAIVAATDQRGVITYVNDKFCEISRYSREELLGQDHRIINSGYHAKEYIRDLWRTIARGRIWRGELRNRAKDGSIYWVDTTIVPLVDERGKPRQYLAIRSDITARKEAEAQLSAQAALTQLGELAAVVAHEVRNPLAGLRASLEVLRSRLPASVAERDVLQTMIERIDSLNTKVTDILRFARPRTPSIRPVNVAPLVVDAITSARAAAGADQCPDVRHVAASVMVAADPDMLRAALLNLVINACQAGGAVVDVSVTASRDVCVISVDDRGAGIPDEVRERVFDAFYTTKKGGTGLGLPIVRRMMELQQGTVTLRRREGGGTTAELTIPLATAAVTLPREGAAGTRPPSDVLPDLADRLSLQVGSGDHLRRHSQDQAMGQAEHPVRDRAHSRSEDG